MMEPLLIILDLDETLVHASSYGYLADLSYDFHVGPYPVYKRPGVDEFIQEVLNEFRVAVWTSASPLYAKEMVAALFGSRADELKFVWDSDRCTQKYNREWGTIDYKKNLKKVKRLNYDLARVIAVDDTPSKYSQNYGNLVTIKEFVGDQLDDSLSALLPYLRRLNYYPDVRKIEKRGWNNVHS